MKRLAVLLLVAGCSGPAKKDMPPVVDPCMGLSPIVITANPPTARVNTAITLTSTGGSGHYAYSVAPGGSGGMVNDDRFIAGPTPATDTITATDDCKNTSTLKIVVTASFSVAPTQATVKPGTMFQVAVSGLLGTAVFTAQSITSGGSISADGHYTAGATDGLDLIEVEDSVSGDQAVLNFTVSHTASFRAAPAKLALPSNASVPITVDDGSGIVNWVVTSGPGSVDGGNFITDTASTGTAVLTGTDAFTKETTTLTVQVLGELKRSGRPHGRLTDVASIVTGDFDGDGIQDVAVGVPESDLSHPQGGAVFIYKGAATGLPMTPTWTITGDTDTAQLGAVMAAGDLDGDGIDDLAISAPGDDIIEVDSGAVLLYRFDSTGPVLIRDPLSGLSRGANFGAAIAIADIDGDGQKDLIVGSPGADLAATATISSRGVIDVFLLKAGVTIPDVGVIRLGGWDTAGDGTFKVTTGLRFARALVVADFNNDGHADIASLGQISPPAGDGGVQRSQYAIAVHLGRSGMPTLEDNPDLFLLVANLSDTDEGNGRLGVVPADNGKPTMLLLTLERTDSPNLSANDAGTVGGVNTGGALFFDLSANAAGMAPPAMPTLIQRSSAFAQIYGDTSGIQAGRSFTVANIDGQPGLELVMGAPYAATAALPNAGKLLVYPLGTLSSGSIINRPEDFRLGARGEALGTAVAYWTPGSAKGLVALAPRATTQFGDFTGRVESASGSGALASWTVATSELPAKLASEQFGLAVRLGASAGKMRALVGAPGFSGPDPNNLGTDTQVGEAMTYDVAVPATAALVQAGAITYYVPDGGAPAYGGRAAAFDVALTDFDGDGRLDDAIAMPGFFTPANTSTDFAILVTDAGCTGGQALGGVSVHVTQSDGTSKEAFRVWAPLTISNCDAGCSRSAVSRLGIAGGFDFNHDGKQDLAVTRSNGLEIFLGRALDDPTLNKLTAACGSAFSLPALTAATYGPVSLGDIDGDGCDDVAVRYGAVTATASDPLVTPNGIVIVFGADPGGQCGAHTQPVWIRISGEADVGLNSLQLGFGVTRAGKVLGDARDFIAISARLYPYEGVTQPTVLLYDIAQILAKRPASGGVVAGALSDGLVPIPVLYKDAAPNLGRALVGNIDVTGDGIVDLIVSSPGANVNGDGTGAVFVFAGGANLMGPTESAYTIVGDPTERSNFGQDLFVGAKSGTFPATLGIGAPISYRTGTANGTAFVLPLGP